MAGRAIGAGIFPRVLPLSKRPLLLHLRQNPPTTLLSPPRPLPLALSHTTMSQNGFCDPEKPLLRVKKLSQNAILPSRASALSAGYDLSSAVEATVPARGRALVATDLSISIPVETYARIAPRSGLSWKHAIDVGAGVVDADYRGPVGVLLFNHSDLDFQVKAGDRIAQLIIERIMTPEVVEVLDLDSTARGEGGFGSTGV
ncbi:deoxyuridine 5'-triphosphate nucleotidohydrolase-like [Ananas comosus]|uniref:Deoxyuridine 5'-triphosphate nucleotidohydrolase n=1 Tax=Ananas comosus TaxID=4615 RepID=A0A6P5EVW3_ANACO|nr:deoxyuridine 5'-triphosphate nucleotidohydrolase-like [Ananas comosus]XP_020098305.1 deoxyuridine 5'-triphosphate nucleotidohydrolase-like [Ananas comosus]